MDIPRADVIIVGGGLAGLACARCLRGMGIAVLVLEAADRPGGRVKTDREDGFLLDHGFQVLQTAYPEARAVFDYDELDLRPFLPGAMFRMDHQFFKVVDPGRRPRYLLRTLRAPVGTLGDKWRLLRLTRKACRSRLHDLYSGEETAALEYLQNCGFTDTMIERFFRPFFSGISLDPDLRVSHRMLRFVLRMFAQDDVALPNGGMDSLVQQLAAGIPGNRILTGIRVVSAEKDRAILDDGTRLKTRAVVVATDGPGAARLLGEEAWNVDSCCVNCLYFAAKTPPVADKILVVNAEPSGVINTLCVPSQVAPGYAPAGESLVAVTVLGERKESARQLELAVRRQLREWFSFSIDQWRFLKFFRIHHALPLQVPPLGDPAAASVQTETGVFICGEYKTAASIQWALYSGRRTAEAVAGMLRSGGAGSREMRENGGRGGQSAVDA